MRTIRFGVIGCGMMGREFASAAARWHHLTQPSAKPVVAAVCASRIESTEWFRGLGTVELFTTDYRELLARRDIEAVYCAVPHHLHREMYTDTIRAGKALMGEKPFGIDLEANNHILQAMAEHPDAFVRCASQFPFFPACRQLHDWLGQGKLGRIIEVRAGFNHSSDLDPRKPINWKRMVKYNGEYGCMGDLGFHTQHLPFRAGFVPRSVYARLGKYIASRPDGKGGQAACDTWDNAILLCDAADRDGNRFPMYLETKRMMPGATNVWYIEVYGMQGAARFSTEDPDGFHYTESWGREQAWCRVDIGYKPQFPAVTGGIFQFGFTDAILQMWAAFVEEYCGKRVAFGCGLPEETRLSHRVFTAALESERTGTAVMLPAAE